MEVPKCIVEGCEDGRSNGQPTCLQHIPAKEDSIPHYQPTLVHGVQMKTVVSRLP
jgi:hypothetical protein